MQSSKDDKNLVVITTICFLFNLISLVGMLFPHNSLQQVIAFRIGDTAAGLGCITCGKYVGNRGLLIASCGFVMLGIVHGISAGASGLSGINVDSTAGLIIPMIPTFILMAWCTIFPVWIRVAGLLLILPFAAVFYRVVNGMEFYHWTLLLAFSLLAILEMLWAVFLWKDLKK